MGVNFTDFCFALKRRNCSSLWNSTGAFPEDLTKAHSYYATRVIAQLAPPLILALGTFGNVMTIIILRRSGTGTTTLFFMSMACSDLFLLLSGPFKMCMEEMFRINVANLNAICCKLFNYAGYSSGVLSAWLLVAMSVQRAVSVAVPHRVSLMCNRKMSLQLIVGITTFVLLMHAHILYGFDTVAFVYRSDVICSTYMYEYVVFMIRIWSWIDLISFSLAPLLLLLVSNSVLVWKVKDSAKGLKSVASQALDTNRREKRVSSITFTLICVSVTFILLTLPRSVTLLLLTSEQIFRRVRSDTKFRVLIDLVMVATEMLWYSNSAVNFYLYCLTGTKFRTEFKHIFCSYKGPRGKSAILSTRSEN